MPLAKVQIHQMIQDSQDYGSDDEHMISRIFFDLDVDGTLYRDLYVNVKQTVGSSFETGPIEVSKPVGYKGPWDHEVFGEFAGRYYRSLVGAAGSGIKITGGSNIRMQNNRFVRSANLEFQVKATGGPW